MAVIIKLPSFSRTPCLKPYNELDINKIVFKPNLSFPLDTSKLLSSKFFVNKNSLDVPYEKLFSSVRAWFLLRVHPSYGISHPGNHFYIGTDCNNTAIDLGGFITSPYYYTTYTVFGTCPRYCDWNYEYNTVSLNHLVHAFASSTLEELLDKLTVNYFPSNTYSGDTCGYNYGENFYTIFTPNGNIKDYIRYMASQLRLL